MPSNKLNLLDVNPLERITGDVAISQFNYESIMNALVQWDNSRNDSITVRLATRTDPYFVDYVLHTKYYYDKNYGVINSAVLLQPNGFAYKNRIKMPSSIEDAVTLRINAVDSGDTTWKLYEDVVVYDEVIRPADEGIDPDTYEHLSNVDYVKRPTKLSHSYDKAGLYIRLYDNVTNGFVLYKTLERLTLDAPTDGTIVGTANGKLQVSKIVGGVTTTVDFAEIVCKNTTQKRPDSNFNFFYYSYNVDAPNDGTVYVQKMGATLLTQHAFTQESSGYEMFCGMYHPDRQYRQGDIVYCSGEFYVSLTDSPALPPVVLSAATPTSLGGFDAYETQPSLWARVLLIPFNDRVITGSGIIRTIVDTDIQGYVLRNIGKTESGEKTSISIVGTISIPAESSEQAKGVNILQTSNYANWPESMTAKWSEGTSYVTDANLSAFSKQDYSAVLVLKHHGDDEHYCYKNIINYDGPDVDQGLCVLLPVTIYDENNMTYDPADGSMLEFLFNIWPNHKYDGRAANDLIINKSQIYVYSVPDYSEYKTNGFNVHTVEPIAKFSMARLVNFYMFSENVGVPDRPVCYKARFIYSKAEHRWKTYDYYQFPDHIFLSPHGFVDPSDPKAYSVQTAGFPLYQNPFSNYDLSAIHVDSEYRNQLQNPDIAP